MQSARYCCPILMKIGKQRRILIELRNINFMKIRSSALEFFQIRLLVNIGQQ
jgi:hypothetical protein